MTTHTAASPEKAGGGTSSSAPLATARNSSAGSDASRGSTTWASGSPKRTLYSMTLVPSEVSMSPA